MGRKSPAVPLVFGIMFLLIAAWFFPRAMYPLHLLQLHGVRTEGQVLTFYPPQGRRSAYFSYGFHVDGKPYEANGYEFSAVHRTGPGAPASGDAVEVYYLPSDPATSAAGDPGQQLGMWYLMTFFYGVMVIGAFWLSAYLRRRNGETEKAILAAAIQAREEASRPRRRRG